MSDTTKDGVHVSSIRLLVVVWIALMIGTWLTVTATYVDLGPLNIWIGLLIATVKAVLVGLYYMHLRWDKPFNTFVFLSAFLFLGIFVGIAMMDTGHYQDDIIAGFASAVGSAAPSPE
jgi:cytochrome c oxidase subunit 4